MHHMAMALEQAKQQVVEGGYPQRPGEPDCVYYLRNGLCGYGARCRFNHPPSRKLGIASVRSKEEFSEGLREADWQCLDQAGSKDHFPERIGQPDCQYYLRTGGCKYGATCKYHHPWERAGSPKEVQLNLAGLPMRLGERDCMYYTHTGSCKFGMNCKFHHPQPGAIGGTMLPMTSSPVYRLGAYPSLDPVSYPGVAPTWLVARASYVPGLRVSAPTSYTPMILPPQWTGFKGPINPITPLDGMDQSPKVKFVFGTTVQKADVAGAQSKSSRASSPPSAHEDEFPEREGQPECQYYLKTGDCKFGASCKFHHPRDRATTSSPSCCTLSIIGLPLRPGQPQCSFYLRYGICKFGPVCKFDHPVVAPVYNVLPSSVFNMTAGSNGKTPLSAAFATVTVSSPGILHAVEHVNELSAKEVSGSGSCVENPAASPPEDAENHTG